MSKEKKKNDYDLHKSLEDLSTQMNAEGFALSSEDMESLFENIDNEALNEKRIKSAEANIGAIMNFLSEYFEAFMILAYDLNGDRIVFQNHGDSSLKQDALFKLLEHTFIKFVQQTRAE